MLQEQEITVRDLVMPSVWLLTLYLISMRRHFAMQFLLTLFALDRPEATSLDIIRQGGPKQKAETGIAEWPFEPAALARGQDVILKRNQRRDRLAALPTATVMVLWTGRARTAPRRGYLLGPHVHLIWRKEARWLAAEISRRRLLERTECRVMLFSPRYRPASAASPWHSPTAQRRQPRAQAISQVAGFMRINAAPSDH